MITQIIVVAKTNQDRAGNTYHVTSVTATNEHGEVVYSNTMPMKYGYGEQYLCDALEHLSKQGVIENYTHNSVPWSYCCDRNIQLIHSASEVSAREFRGLKEKS